MSPTIATAPNPAKRRRQRRRRRGSARTRRRARGPLAVSPAALRWSRAVVPLAVVALALGACGAADGDSGAGEAAGGGEAAAPADVAEDLAREESGAFADTAADRALADDVAAPVRVGVPADRKVIRTAELTMEMTDTATALARITAVVERAGGFVASAELGDREDDRPAGTITVRVPTTELQATLGALEDLADDVPFRRIGSQDVTEEFADVEARLRNLTALETELVALLTEVRESSNKASEILQVFERVRQVRGEIEQLEGRRRLLSDLVALATVHIEVVPTVAVPGLLADDGWQPVETAREALSATVGALADIGDLAIWLLLAVVPIVALLLVPVAGAFVWWRRRRRTAAATS